MQVGHGRAREYAELTTEVLIDLLDEERDQKERNVRKTMATSLLAAAGAGKTFFMRNLYLKLTKSLRSKVPIFLDARELNELPLTDFAGVVTAAFKVAGQQFSEELALDGP
jgi:hypothetical protein